MSTLTREQLIDHLDVRYEEVEIPKWGTIGLRSRSQGMRSHRISQLMEVQPHELADTNTLYSIIDHVMVDRETPMFKDDDLDMLRRMDGEKMDALTQAILKFNGGDSIMGKRLEEEDLDDGSES